MQHVQSFVKWTAQRIPQRPGSKSTPNLAEPSSDEEDFIYSRVAAHSDDEGPDQPTKHRTHRRRASEPSVRQTDTSPEAMPNEVGSQLPPFQIKPGSRSDGELLCMGHNSASHPNSQRHLPMCDLIDLDTPDASTNANASHSPPASAPIHAPSSSSSRSTDDASHVLSHEVAGLNVQQHAGDQQHAEPSGKGASDDDPQGGAVQGAISERGTTSGFDNEEDSGVASTSAGGNETLDSSVDHTEERRELLIYALPLLKGKVRKM